MARTTARGVVRRWLQRRAAAPTTADTRLFTAARHIVGPTGIGSSPAWDALDERGGAYLQSFDPRVPRSVHLAGREAGLASQPIPVAERCLADAAAARRARRHAAVPGRPG